MKGRDKRLGLALVFCLLFTLTLLPVLGQVNSQIYTRYYDILQAGKSTVFVEEVSVPFRKIDLDLTASSFNVRFYFNSYDYNPSNLPFLLNVYQYINVIVTNLDVATINEEIIEFRVEKSWMTTAGIGEITLHALDNDQWRPLSTKRVGEDASNYYYQASASSFGFFAIGGEEGSIEEVVEEEVVEEVVVEAEEEPEEEAVEEETPDIGTDTPPVEEEGGNRLIFALAAVLTILTLGGGGMYFYRKELFGVETLEEHQDAHKPGEIQMLEDVDEDKKFQLSDGTEIRNLHDLVQALHSISDAVYSQYVLGEKNEFADWVQKHLGRKDLAKKMRSAANRVQLTEIVEADEHDADTGLLKNYFVGKYKMTEKQYESLSHLVHRWKGENLQFSQMRERLVARNLGDDAIEDLLYGPPETVEDFTLHPDDEAALNVFLFDAMSHGMTQKEVRQHLLESGWPRAVVEKKVVERFRKGVSQEPPL